MDTLTMINHIRSIGNNRLLFNDQWQRTRNYLKGIGRDLGLTVQEDVLGNLTFRLEGFDNQRSIGVISHYDSVTDGGAFDGIFGIAAGLESLKNLKDKYGKPDMNLEVLAVCDEEGARFKTTFLGSRALVGQLNYTAIQALKDDNGITFEEARAEAGYKPLTKEDLKACVIKNQMQKCFEVHIEQGKLLDDTKNDIGVVSHIPGQMKVKVTIIGEANHAGTTSMFERKDALCCGAKIVSFVEHLGIKYGGITTTGYSVNALNMTNIIPSRVTLINDIRHHDPVKFKRMLEDLKAYTNSEEERRGVAIHFEKMVIIEPVQLNKGLQTELANVATRLNLKHMNLKSNGGHDIQILSAAGIQSGLLFVPSIKGISHRQDEFTEDYHIQQGVKVLTHTLKRSAYMMH